MKEIVVIEKPTSSISESIKNIRTNLQFLAIDEPIKTLLVTSSAQGEGKTFTSVNLAVSFTQINKKVLIIDCDMRRGRLHEVFKCSNIAGLSSLLLTELVKKNDYGDYIVKTDVKKLDIIPSGFYPPNPSDMLSSKKFAKILSILKEEYDIIILDAVPLNGLSDSLEIAKLADKILVVTALNETPREFLADSKKALHLFEDKVAGIVINKGPHRPDRYYYKSEEV
ncbi:MAG: CpsD/CapB family tyrosine-protein kinase [bacterium]